MKQRFLILICLLTITDLAYSQVEHFSGIWKRNDEKTIVEGYSINSIPVGLEISLLAKTVSIKRISKNAQGDVSTYTEMLFLNGDTSVTTTPSKLKRIARIKWSTDKKQLTETFTSTNEQGEIKQSGSLTFSLINNGQSLKVIAQTDYDDGAVVKSDQQFDKQ